MTQSSANTARFWNQLLTLAEGIDSSAGSLDDLCGFLLAVDEGHSGAFDPADQFPEYAAVQLCRSIRRKLEQLDRP